MKLKVNLIEDGDYEKFCEWWKWNRFPAPPKDCLPNGGFGGLKITGEDGIDICAGFLFETNSGIAWLEFVVSNYEVKNKEIRKEALTDLIRYLTVFAEQKGFKAVFTSLNSIKSKGLIEKHLEIGYSASLPVHTELTIRLDQ